MRNKGTLNSNGCVISIDAPSEHQILVVQSIIQFLSTMIPITFARRIVACLLLILGYQTTQITDLTAMKRSTVYNLSKSLKSALISGNIASLFVMQKGCGRKLVAKDILSQIVETIDNGTYTSLRQIQAMLRTKFQIVLSVSSVSRLISRLGIKRLKASSFPAKANPVIQQSFYDNTLHQLMQDARNGKNILLFMDASHFVLGCDFLGYIYGKSRRFVQSFSGRQRYNVLGALDYVTKQVHTIENTTYITATEVMSLIKNIAVHYGTSKPIRIVLDNARYQKCAAVSDLLESLKKRYDIELVYLPSYSPNLNLIERLWRFVKIRVRSEFFTDFTSFRNFIDETIGSTSTENKAYMDSLIGEKIQLYTSLQPIDAHSFVMPK